MLQSCQATQITQTPTCFQAHPSQLPGGSCSTCFQLYFYYLTGAGCFDMTFFYPLYCWHNVGKMDLITWLDWFSIQGQKTGVSVEQWKTRNLASGRFFMFGFSGFVYLKDSGTLRHWGHPPLCHWVRTHWFNYTRHCVMTNNLSLNVDRTLLCCLFSFQPL